MRVTTKLVIDMNTGETLDHEFYEYDGPVALCGGGPSSQQKQAATAQANLANAETAQAGKSSAIQDKIYGQIAPFATNRLQNGLSYAGQLNDYAGGNTARAYAPARAALARQLGSIGGLPSGFKTGAMADLNENAAQNYDANLKGAQDQNDQARVQGAQILTGQQSTYNPLGYYQAAGTSNNSILQAPLQSPGFAGVLGGIAGGLAGNPALKF